MSSASENVWHDVVTFLTQTRISLDKHDVKEFTVVNLKTQPQSFDILVSFVAFKIQERSSNLTKVADLFYSILD